MKNKHLNKKEEIKEELKGLSSMLYELKEQDSPFQVPEGYFKQFQEDLLDQLKEPAGQTSKGRSFWNFPKLLDQVGWLLQPRTALALSSVLVVLVAAWFLFRTNITPSGQDLSFAALSIEEIQDYIDNNLDDFDEETVKEVAQDDQNIQMISPNAIDSEELDRYLDEMIEDIDLHELEEIL